MATRRASAAAALTDSRYLWLERQLKSHFRNIDFRSTSFTPADEVIINEFFNGVECRALWFCEGRDGNQVLVMNKPPTPSVTKVSSESTGHLYVLKLASAPVNPAQSISDQVLVGDLPIHMSAMEHMTRVTSEIYLPIVTNPRLKGVWSEMIIKDVVDGFNGFISNVQIIQGQVEGATRLPLPPDSAILEIQEPNLNFEDRVFIDVAGEEAMANVDRIYVLEGVIITWTKQIKAVLNRDPENMLQDPHPGPLDEIEFWNSLASNLDCIFAQLQSEKVRRLLRYLDRAKSTYSSPFGKLCKEMFLARSKAKSNRKYLSALRPWCEALENETEFQELPKHFAPILQTTLLIWKSSPYYNTTPRLVVLMREISDSLVRKASEFLSGDRIFEMMDNDESPKAVDGLRTLLRVLGGFKASFFHYKNKSAIEVPENAWTAANSACFQRLDLLLERCHDVLDLAQTMMQYNRLNELEMGGPRGRTLSTSAMQIYSDFLQAIDEVRNLDYDILDLSHRNFDSSWFKFRKQAKLLDQRLAAVVCEGVNTATTTGSAFKILDSFEGLLDRPILAAALEEKYVEVVAMYAFDLKKAIHEFASLRENPPIGKNLPPVAGSLQWANGIESRAKIPMDKIKRFDRKVMERPVAREVVADFSTLIGHLAEFRRKQVDDWAGSVEAASLQKLKGTLLRREVDMESGIPILFVNLAPGLTALLREVKYLLQQGLKVPPAALEVFSRAESLRRHAGNLDLVATSYNAIQASLLPVERPLVKSQLERVDHMLAQSVTVPGQEPPTLSWKSNGIDQFIAEAMVEVRHVEATLRAMKGNLALMEEILDSWSGSGLFARYNKPSTLADFEILQKQVRSQRFALVRSGGEAIHKLLSDSCQRLGLSSGLPDWRSYVDFWNNMVVGGLVQVAIVSLEYLEQQVDPVNIQRTGLPAMLTISIDVIGKKVSFVPELRKIPNVFDYSKYGIRNVVHSWLEGFLGVGATFTRLDSGEGSYSKEIQDDPYVQMLLASINSLLAKMEARGEEYRKQFQEYEYLWTTELKEMFNEFLAKATKEEKEKPSWKKAAKTLTTTTGWIGKDSASRPTSASSSGHNEGGSGMSKKIKDDDENVAEIHNGGGHNGGGDDDDDDGGDVKRGPNERGYTKAAYINLHLFDIKLKEFNETQNQLSELKPYWDLDFLRVNAQPAKQTLATWVTKWTYMFANYLQDHLSSELVKLHDFFRDVSIGLAIEVPAGDRSALLLVMGHVRAVRNSMAAVQASLPPLQELVSLLKAHNIAIEIEPIPSTSGAEDALDFLEQAPIIWESIVNRCFKVKEAILPHQLSIVNDVKSELHAFAVKVRDFSEYFHANGPFQHAFTDEESFYANARRAMHSSASSRRIGLKNTSSSSSNRTPQSEEADFKATNFTLAAYRRINELDEKLGLVEAESRAYEEVRGLFEISIDATLVPNQTINQQQQHSSSSTTTKKNKKKGSKGSRRSSKHQSVSAPKTTNQVIRNLRNDLKKLKQVWDMVSRVRFIFNRWQVAKWQDLDINQLMDETKALSKHVSRNLPRSSVRYWSVFRGLEKDVRKMTMALPLAMDLRTGAMRDRHWRALCVACHKRYDGGSKKAPPFPHVSLGELLSLDLHAHVGGVRDVIDAATQEYKIETKLESISNAWIDIKFEMQPHHNKAFVPVATESLLELLEDHQLDLQTMHASMASASLKSANQNNAMVTANNTNTNAGAGGGSVAPSVGGSTRLSRGASLSNMSKRTSWASVSVAVAAAHAAAAALGGEEELLGSDSDDEEGGGQDQDITTSTDFFKRPVEDLQQRLGKCDNVLKLLLSVVRRWQSLEAIFLGEASDLAASLPQDVAKFTIADEKLKDLLLHIQSNPKVLPFGIADGREYVLSSLLVVLESCQKALDGWLTSKKNAFPRFYFLSSTKLLEVLANGNIPPLVIPPIVSLFDGLGGLSFVHSAEARRTIAELQVAANKAREVKLVAAEKAMKNEARAMEVSRTKGVNIDDVHPEADAYAVLLAEVESGPAYVDTVIPLDAASHMIAKDGEEVEFAMPFLFLATSRSLEVWLNSLVELMQDTVKYSTDTAIEAATRWDIDLPREKWCIENTFCAQAMIIAAKVTWTMQAETALEELENGAEDALGRFVNLCTERLESLILMVQGELSVLNRTKVTTLITADVHCRDTIAYLITSKVESALDFNWRAHLKYYYNTDRKEVTASVCEFTRLHNYEYIGNIGRLVITALTDKCFLTLTTALSLFIGGAPSGPAGTGKTETTKELSRSLGVCCFVFNCSDQYSYNTMADVFCGIVQSGCWACFDEFNRIAIEVLSVVASQVKLIFDSIAKFSVAANRDEQYASLPEGTPNAKVADFEFVSGAETIGLIPTCGIFITMNPNYAGRSDLPENLKVLFRPCAMIRPDLNPICENMLMGEGFVKATLLANKFVTLYKLCGELLSKQPHYDWGLRAIKSVLRVAGKLKRSEPEVDEEAIFMRALRDFNTPKIPVQGDLPIFLRLITDIFPGRDLKTTVNEALIERCGIVCAEMGIQSNQAFVHKVVQYEEMLDVRHSVMVLGPAGCGKSTIWKTLAACHNLAALQAKKKQNTQSEDSTINTNTSIKPVTVYETVNPKAVTNDELYGGMTLTKEWKEGCLTYIMRSMSQDIAPFYGKHQTAKWMILDGDVDAIWIESLNTVMDDNKVLTLVSNERISLTDSMRMVFETHSLKNATPATVSRAGILFVNETDVGYKPYTQSWLSKQSDEVGLIFTPLFEKHIPTALLLLHSNRIATSIPVSTFEMVTTLCSMLQGLLLRCNSTLRASPIYCEHLFLYALMWSFGGPSNGDNGVYENEEEGVEGAGFGPGSQFDSRRAFSEAWRISFKNTTAPYPIEGLVFDYTVSPVSAQWIHWSTTLPQSSTSAIHLNAGNLLIPTVDTARCTDLLSLFHAAGRSALVIGTGGCGKTSLINAFLRDEEERSGKHSVTVNMNFYTNSKDMQAQLERPLEKRGGRVYGPMDGRKMFCFVDDMNMPAQEKFGTQNSLELLRQYSDYKGWFDRSDMTVKKTIVGVSLIGALNFRAGSFFVSSRLQRNFSLVSLQQPEGGDLSSIFGTPLQAHYEGLAFTQDVKACCIPILSATITIYKEAQRRFLPSAVRFHYNFSTRDLGSLIGGLMLATPSLYRSALGVCRLWYHEATRVFSDRLVSSLENTQCEALVQDVARRYLGDFVKFEELFAQPCNFTHFATSSIDDEAEHVGMYLPVSDDESLRTVLEESLLEHNEECVMMDLVLFKEACEHVCRCARVLARPRGHVLLVGVGGSGKRSLARLASFVCGYTVTPMASKSSNISGNGYGVADLKEELKQIYLYTGIRPAEPVVFLITDTVIDNGERLLVDVNDMLASGDIPNLFAPDELDSMFSSLRSIARNEGVADTRQAMREFFLDRVRTNLHVVMCMSPTGDLLRVRSRKFPALIGCTAVDWFHEWPREALVKVATHFLKSSAPLQKDYDLKKQISEEKNKNKEDDKQELEDENDYDDGVHPSEDNPKKKVKGGVEAPTLSSVAENIAHHMATVHEGVGDMCRRALIEEKRRIYVTPKSFLGNVSLFLSLLTKRSDKLSNDIKRYELGLKTLKETESNVESLKEELRAKMLEVARKREATDKLLDAMGTKKEEAEAQAIMADQERDKADQAARDAGTLEIRATGDLENAKPALAAAASALGQLDKASMTELKGFSKLPTGVDKVATALLMLIKGETKDFSWENAKRMLAKVDWFMATLKSFTGEDIPPDVMVRIQPILDDPVFTYDKMKAKSLAAASLCSWVVNITQFHKVYCRVKPLMEQLASAKQTKANAELELDAVESDLRKLDAKLAELQSAFMSATAEKASCEAEAAACSARLKAAERLTNGLASEYERWGAEVFRLRNVQACVSGDSVFAASFVSYASPFSSSLRAELYHAWVGDLGNREIPLTDGAEPVSLVATTNAIADWRAQGLPSDKMSTENGAIVSASLRWPLLIDPQLQGINWIRSKEANLVSISPSTNNWTRTLARGVTNGDAVVVDGLNGQIDPILSPLIARDVVRKGRSFFLTIGSEEVLYDEGFRLYLHTQLSNPHFSPEVAAQCVIINFTVTESGLEDQFLSRVVSIEQPDLEEEKEKLSQSFHKYHVELSGLEDLILSKLESAPTDILSDLPLIESLEETKEKAISIQAAVVKAKKAELGIAFAREVYRCVAAEASAVYFLALQLSSVNHMYQFSLANFERFFQKGIEEGEENEDLRRRVSNLRLSVRYALFSMVSRGLFDRHRVAFLTRITILYMDEDKKYQIALANREKEENEAQAEEELNAIGEDFGENFDGNETEIKLPPFKEKPAKEVGYSIAALQFLLNPMATVNNGHNGGGGMSIGTSSVIPNSGRRDSARSASGHGSTFKVCPIAWLSEEAWEMAGALSLQVQIGGFESFQSDLADAAPRFLEWFSHPSPESQKLPLEYRNLDTLPFKKLLVIRVLRPDRVIDALKKMIKYVIPTGQIYLNGDSSLNSFQVLDSIFKDASSDVPVFFILSQGADVVADVDKLAVKYGRIPGVSYHNVSLGQGQDVVAEARLTTAHKQGHWVMLNNVHLMPRWLNRCDDLLVSFQSAGSHPNFRVLFSADPSNQIPTALLARCIKLASDPPGGLKATMKRSLCCFSKDSVEEMEPMGKGILFGLCYFHAVMSERRQFGSLGFNFTYPFNSGDLVQSSMLIDRLLEDVPPSAPWDDIRSLVGDVMYGGHIVDDVDARICNTFLDLLMCDNLLDEADLFFYADNKKTTGFQAPQTSKSFEGLLEHVEKKLYDSPLALGFHPNADIIVRNDMAMELLQTVRVLAPSSNSLSGANQGNNGGGGASVVSGGNATAVSALTGGGGGSGVNGGGSTSVDGGEDDGGGGGGGDGIADLVLQDITERLLGRGFDLSAIQGACASEGVGPYQNVFLQECAMLNHLIATMIGSLEELSKGIKGELIMSEAMEKLSSSLSVGNLPQVWRDVSYPTKRQLSSWVTDLIKRITQMETWANRPTTIPVVTWISGLSNPQSFLTAVMQTSAHENAYELDRLSIFTEVTKKMDPLDFPTTAKDGVYIYGLTLEGARWALGSSNLEPSMPREPSCVMPVMNVRAVMVTPLLTKASGGSSTSNTEYECPVYATRERGSTHVFDAKLRTRAAVAKWILAGVALILDMGN